MAERLPVSRSSEPAGRADPTGTADPAHPVQRTGPADSSHRTDPADTSHRTDPASTATVDVLGLGADGWGGLATLARATLDRADVIFGSRRQLDLLPPHLSAEQVCWPSPLAPALPGLLTAHPGRRVVLASGDPTWYGIATTIARLLPDLPLRIVPHPSSLSLACARLGWAQQEVEVISLVGRPVEILHPAITPGRRLLVLAGGVDSPAETARLLRNRGFAPTRLIALSDLGSAQEQRVESTAGEWPAAGAGRWPIGTAPRALTVLGLECIAGTDANRLTRTPGLPDNAYENDGQLTRRQIRAITLASLAPAPGELLWDVGGGAGSIGIEWMRTHPTCSAISVERDGERANRIRRNAVALGVPGLGVVGGSAPAALAGLPTPDAVFIGGGASTPGLIETCWQALPVGGRLVANVTTVESEQAIVSAWTSHGGELTRIEITSAAPIGRYTGWRPAMPVTQWTAIR